MKQSEQKNETNGSHLLIVILLSVSVSLEGVSAIMNLNKSHCSHIFE